MSQESAFAYLRHGQMPFFRLPAVAAPDMAATSYDGLDAVLLGVPYDGGTTYQPGARLAPFAVRRVSALVQTVHPGQRVDVFDTLRVADGGNVVFSPFQPEGVRAQIELEVGRIVGAGAVPFVVGGDHSVALPALRAVAKKHGPVALVHVDAHLDLSGPEGWGADFHHGTPIRHALAEGLVAQGALFQIGMRATWASVEDDALARAHGGHLFLMDHVEREGVGRIMAQIRERVGQRPVYLSFDVDAVDPAFAPGTGTPVPGGLTSREALAIVRGLPPGLVGVDVVEVSPPQDHADMTSHLGAALLLEALAVLAKAR